MSYFRITQGKGFYFGFPNGWGVSVQFGPRNYADNYNDHFGKDACAEAGRRGSFEAECAIIDPKGKLVPRPDEFCSHMESEYRDIVFGYCAPEKVMRLLAWAQKQPKE